MGGKNAGDVVSLVKDYNLKIVVKSVKTNIEQIYGGENPLSDVDVNVVRKIISRKCPPMKARD